MKKVLDASTLILPGFALESVSSAEAVTVIAVRSVSSASRCPVCGTCSRRVHSRYVRKLADLPLGGRSFA